MLNRMREVVFDAQQVGILVRNDLVEVDKLVQVALEEFVGDVLVYVTDSVRRFQVHLNKDFDFGSFCVAVQFVKANDVCKNRVREVGKRFSRVFLDLYKITAFQMEIVVYFVWSQKLGFKQQIRMNLHGWIRGENVWYDAVFVGVEFAMF